MNSNAPIPVRAIHTQMAAPEGVRIVELAMTAHDRRRVRRIVEAPDGVQLALELPTGTVLHPGQLLHHDAEAAYVVSAAEEAVLVIWPAGIAEAARIAHLIGNLHRDIHVDGDTIITLADDTLSARIAKEGVRFERTRRPFHGRSQGEHAH
jgi:urease accessory protein